MRRGALEWLGERRERAEQREARALGVRLAGVEEARRLQRAADRGLPEGAAPVSALGLAADRRAWAGEELARRARQVQEARARVQASRAAAEALRRLLALRAEARRRERERRCENLADEGRLQAWARRREA